MYNNFDSTKNLYICIAQKKVVKNCNPEQRVKTGEQKRSQFALLVFYLVKTQKIFYSFT